MNTTYGQEAPAAHADVEHVPPARWLVVIDSADGTVARLFLESREQVADFDAAQAEVVQMTAELEPAIGAEGPEWDVALAGHSPAERKAARVYELAI